jgi:hypothetical protein
LSQEGAKGIIEKKQFANFFFFVGDL